VNPDLLKEVAVTGVTHIAGNDIQIGNLLRQRCAWCGAVLVDYNLDQIMYTEDTPVDERRPATWPVGELVEIDGIATKLVPHENGAQLPANACGRIEAAITV